MMRSICYLLIRKMLFIRRLIYKFSRMVVGLASLQQVAENDPVRLRLQKTREEHARVQKFDYSHVFR